MYQQFKSISISYRTAPLEIREQIALNEEEAKALMLRLKDFFELSDVLVVSTCNRTEIYYTSPQDLNSELVKLLLIQKGIADPASFHEYFEHYRIGKAAVRHLFEVATGLHSQVVGDMQIPNQIKQAYQWSADLHMAGPFLHRLLHTIFFANKRVAQETSFRDGAASVSYAAVELVETLAIAPKVLVVGLGEIGADVCKNLAQKGDADITLINRTRAKAEALAATGQFRVADFADLDAELSRADIIITSIQSGQPFFTKQMVQALNGLTYKYFIDLAVPRSVEPEVEQLPGVMLYNIDTVRSRANAALARRMEAVPTVEAIIDESVTEFNDWSKEMVVSPTINKLKNALEQIRQEEMARFTKQLSEEEAAKMDKITSSMMQKIIKLPVLQLKAACKRGEAETLIDVLNDLFNLEAVRS
ncbi:glutamyl-tRNA reductase [Persicitalea jodogahamensis]|uniref:Glutamyl-tRNA reductase n=1 Tax=Persicitalea jodogahamensis TaxID=402147 RepID=A0A8J3D823_9BACT|nr:glutamyl-tRNA reductase [Persicitalea jodogahamensis]GHB59452.1 glutamyl-tRNA reductase [Persicitalea jodogahamensis]